MRLRRAAVLNVAAVPAAVAAATVGQAVAAATVAAFAAAAVAAAGGAAAAAGAAAATTGAAAAVPTGHDLHDLHVGRRLRGQRRRLDHDAGRLLGGRRRARPLRHDGGGRRPRRWLLLSLSALLR